ncbi:MAG: hypothetical protein Q8933_14745 [Bacteroidota bacterium]|nr:hypothetical protein [Bacteroidota bacterium]MDP4193059.1 hypothetical protein [Bacteroidota bacterium]MDP4196187.1 hypothetical protein [Bacteroidota bacterium]
MRKISLMLTITLLFGLEIFAQPSIDGQILKEESKDTLSLSQNDITSAAGDESSQSSSDKETVSDKEEIENLKGALDGLNESYLDTKSTVDALKKIKISGYIQAQFQSGEIDGTSAAGSGGDFSKNMHNRFAIRRGRLKASYDNDITQYVLQINVDEKGLGLKDAYASIKDPWIKTFGLTAGVFNRPFGFEVPYSSSDLESPERTRFNQTLFPGEEDMGAQLEITPQDGPLSCFNLKAGIFSGNGIAQETDNYKDFIGRLGFKFPFEEENLAIDGGVSTYLGAVRVEDGKSLYKLNSPTTFERDSLTRKSDRVYYGADLQLYYDLPVLGGFTIRGEYVSGKNPGSSSSNKPYTYAVGNSDVFLRNIACYYITYVQNIGLSNQFVIKYESYDPNTDVKGDDIKGASGSKLSSADIKFSTLGVGWNYFWDSNVKFTLFYDIVKNEKVNPSVTAASLTPYKDDLKDNVLTLRMQIKF